MSQKFSRPELSTTGCFERKIFMAKDILVSVSYGASDETLAADIGRIESALQAAMPG